MQQFDYNSMNGLDISYIYSPKCDILCRLRASLLRNDFVQFSTLQWKGFSPKCIFMCVFKLPATIILVPTIHIKVHSYINKHNHFLKLHKMHTRGLRKSKNILFLSQDKKYMYKYL